MFNLPFLYRELEGDLDKPEHQVWVAWSYESEVNYPWMLSDELKDLFDLWMTYHLDSDIVLPYYDYTFKEKLLTPPCEKTKDVCMFISSPVNNSRRLEYFSELPRIDYNGKYITCGLYSQHSLYKEDNWVKSQNYMLSLSEAISRNVSIIGNCIGVTMDLQKAILDYMNGNFGIIIDSIHNHNSINEFLRKSFHEIPRFGKVVYKYDNN